MTSRELLLEFAHILMAMAFAAGLVGRGATFRAAADASSFESLASLLSLSEWFDRTLVIPPYLALIATGLATALTGGWPLLAGHPEARWLDLSILLFLSPMLVIPFYLIPRGRARRRALADSVARGSATPELAAALADPGVIWFRRIELMLVVVIAGLMVLKPF